VIDVAEALRLLCGSNEGSLGKRRVIVRKSLVGQMEVSIALVVVVSQFLVVENKNLFELVQAIVVKGNGLNFTKCGFLQIS